MHIICTRDSRHFNPETGLDSDCEAFYDVKFAVLAAKQVIVFAFVAGRKPREVSRRKCTPQERALLESVMYPFDVLREKLPDEWLEFILEKTTPVERTRIVVPQGLVYYFTYPNGYHEFFGAGKSIPLKWIEQKFISLKDGESFESLHSYCPDELDTDGSSVRTFFKVRHTNKGGKIVDEQFDDEETKRLCREANERAAEESRREERDGYRRMF